MPGPSQTSLGSIQYSFILQLTIPAGAAITASTTVERTYTLPGIQLGDIITVNAPALTAGIGIVNARASATDQIAITFSNSTAGTPSLPANGVYLIQVDRGMYPTVAQIPTGIA